MTVCVLVFFWFFPFVTVFHSVTMTLSAEAFSDMARHTKNKSKKHRAIFWRRRGLHLVQDSILLTVKHSDQWFCDWMMSQFKTREWRFSHSLGVSLFCRAVHSSGVASTAPRLSVWSLVIRPHKIPMHYKADNTLVGIISLLLPWRYFRLCVCARACAETTLQIQINL